MLKSDKVENTTSNCVFDNCVEDMISMMKIVRNTLYHNEVAKRLTITLNKRTNSMMFLCRVGEDFIEEIIR